MGVFLELVMVCGVWGVFLELAVVCGVWGVFLELAMEWCLSSSAGCENGSQKASSCQQFHISNLLHIEIAKWVLMFIDNVPTTYLSCYCKIE